MTSSPAVMQTCAMPEPMAPKPTTPTFFDRVRNGLSPGEVALVRGVIFRFRDAEHTGGFIGVEPSSRFRAQMARVDHAVHQRRGM